MLGSGRDCPEALAKGSSGSQAENLAISLGSRWGTRGTRTKERPPSLGGRSRCVLWTYLRAGDGARTRDPQLGKLMLYQLSYSRNTTITQPGGLQPPLAGRRVAPPSGCDQAHEGRPSPPGP